MIDLFGSKRRTATHAVLPTAATHELLRQHPRLTASDVSLVLAGLRQWYRVVQLAGGRPLAMPSRVVDDLWHAHITCTRDYAAFCRDAFLRFLHHDPESTMDEAAATLNGGEHLRRTLALSRKVEATPGLPLLFRIDTELGVGGARCYVLTCGAEPCTSGPDICLAHLPGAVPRQRVGSSRSGSPRSRRQGCGTGGGGGGWADAGGSTGDGGGCGGGCGG